MLRHSPLAVFVTVGVVAFATACEQDDRPKPELAAAKPVTASVARPQSGAAPAPTGACGPEEQKAGGSACGAGCGCSSEGCGEPTPKPEGCGCGMHDPGKAETPVVPITAARVGDRTRCPVTNQVFVVNVDSPKADFDGKTYYFCCDGCVNKFKQNPQQFTNT